MIQFYCPDIESTGMLPESDSGHAVRVLRLREGDRLQVVDGKGHTFDCVLTSAHSKHATVEICNKTFTPLPWPMQINVAVAPTKSMDRMEWMVEKLVEIGVNRITPILCRHSERKDLKVERLEKIAVSAMKQSLKSSMPIIDSMVPIDRYIDECTSALKYVAYCADIYPRTELAQAYLPGQDVTFIIGPEGDFTPQEVAHAIDCGFVPVTLGPCRLRTETSALAALQTIHTLNLANFNRPTN